MPIFFISAEQIRDGTLSIRGPLQHHLRASLRYKVGDELWVTDDRRCRYRIQLAAVGPHELTGKILEVRPGPTRSAPRMILGQAVLKGERMDWVIQKATEIGVAAIVPIVSAQTVVRPRQQRVDTQHARWQRIALEAAQQSERWEVPRIDRSVVAETFFSAPGEATWRYILVEPEAETSRTERLSSIALPNDAQSTVVLAIGPEGGWRQEEVQGALSQGFKLVSLGPRVLRAETATLAALAVLQSRLGELG
jgi:16S rRNA (uracil1498-N3)-methyltransferase